jgi:hypothetical protein
MYPNGWVKLLSSGHRVLGSDSLVKEGKAYWRNSPMDIVQAVVAHNGIVGTIIGPGNYWQADDYESCMRTKKVSHLRRRISRQIQTEDMCVQIEIKNNYLSAVFRTAQDKVDSRFLKYIFVPEHFGKWFNVEVPINGDQPWWHISEERK